MKDTSRLIWFVQNYSNVLICTRYFKILTCFIWTNQKNNLVTGKSRMKFLKVFKSGKSPQICFQLFNLNRPRWFITFGELHRPWKLNVTWQWSKLFTAKVYTRSLKNWKEQVGRPGKLLESHDGNVRKLMLFVVASFIVAVNKRLDLRARLPLDACVSAYLFSEVCSELSPSSCCRCCFYRASVSCFCGLVK